MSASRASSGPSSRWPRPGGGWVSRREWCNLAGDPNGGRTLLTAAIVALVVSFLATLALRRLAPRLGLLDRANPRSSHVGEVPRGGGLGLVLGAGVGLGLAGAGCGLPCNTVLAGVVVLATVGLCDDRWGLPPLARLGCHTLAAITVVSVTGGIDRLPLPPPLDVPLGAAGFAIAVLWIVAAVNFYNFLDGIDGLAGLQALVTGTGIALAGWESLAATLGASVAGAALGFLLHNWSPARIFLGDVGSGVLGFVFAAVPLLAPPGSRPAAVGFVAASLFLFLADATWTLAARVGRGARFYEAHREHVYQRLVIGGRGHAPVASALGLSALLITSVALLAWRRHSPAWGWAALALATTGFGVELVLARRAARAVPVGSTP